MKHSNPKKKKNIVKNYDKNKTNVNHKSKNDKNKNLNRLETNKIKYKKILIEENGIKLKLNQKQIYELFLLLNKFVDSELNNLSYNQARQIDKRKFCDYYFSLILTKHLLFFSFFPKFDFNSKIIKIFLFFLNFTVNFIVNALFFNDDTMHKIYTDGGSFNFIYNIPQILYSSIITEFILDIITNFGLSDSNFIKLRQCNNRNAIKIQSKNVLRILKIKFILFFVLDFILLIIFWFYLACFCAVYKNTQMHLIKDTLISFGTSMIYPFGIFLVPCIFRIISLNKKNRKCMYNFSKIIEIL